MLTLLGDTLSSIAVLFLVSSGLAVIFGVLRIINFAHGDFVMVGAFASVISQEWGLGFALSIVFAMVVVAGLSVGLQALGLARTGLDMTVGLLVTWAYGTLIRSMVAAIFGPQARFADQPFPGRVTALGGTIPYYVLFVFAAALVVAAVLFVVFVKTDFGRRLRATVCDRQMAAGVGINTGGVTFGALAAAGALAGLAGALIAPMVSVNAYMGFAYIVRAFLVVVLGGLGSVVGAGGGAVVIGGAETLVSRAMSALLAQVVIFLFVAAALVFRARLERN